MRCLRQDIYDHTRRLHTVPPASANGCPTATEVSLGPGPSVEISPLPSSKLAVTGSWDIGVGRRRNTHDLKLPLANELQSRCTNIGVSDLVAANQSKRLRRDGSDSDGHVEAFLTYTEICNDTSCERRLYKSIRLFI